ncbi:hypothetical protein CPB84DRAFT_1849388 [Gymnopilus junonius]|uniref:F-box domain-containing protein n=1 Tax=Gymnopilus junonius TaxID=109634 RepID=A0A9P5NJS6_GYMJU|nr:hypothetical protein CPB84DRAFT_1849388 [Gymnopilus junonius]
MPQLLDLPPEILVNIFLFLHFLDVGSCKRTCLRLCDVISNSSQIAYHVELQVAGMQDNPNCKLPITVRLQMIKDREEAWGSFKPQFTKNVQVPFESSGLYDVTPDLYLAGKNEKLGRRVTNHIQAIRLPHKKGEDPTWHSVDFASNIVDFATSIEEDDLLAAVTMTKQEGRAPQMSIVLRRFSTQQLYDGIANPVIFICDMPQDVEGRPAISIEIAGAHLVVIPEYMIDDDALHDQRPLMYIWNWKTGKRLADPIPVENPGLVFLREDIFLNPSMPKNSIDIYHISDDNVHLMKQLSFPSLQFERAISLIACRGDPSPTANGTFPKHTPQRRPYTNCPEDAIIVFAIQIGDQGDVTNDEADHFFMIVHRRALLSLLVSNASTSSSQEVPAEIVPWESWGPAITRWLPAESWSMNFITLSAGQRFVFLSIPSDLGDSDDGIDLLFEPLFTLLDFNPWNVKRFQGKDLSNVRHPTRTVIGVNPIPASTPVEENHPLAELPENICPRLDSFAEDVVSRLPYVEYSHLDHFHYMAHTSVLIDEERLIGLKSHSPQDLHFDQEADSLDAMYFG